MFSQHRENLTPPNVQKYCPGNHVHWEVPVPSPTQN